MGAGIESGKRQKRGKAVEGLWSVCRVGVSRSSFFLYPLCNAIASHRLKLFEFFHPLELRIPFIPEAIWLYLLLYLLFAVIPFHLDSHRINALKKRLIGAIVLGAIMFLGLPHGWGSPRNVPDSPLYGPIYNFLFSIDRPHNLVPSLHVTFCALILWALGGKWNYPAAKVFVNIVLALIGLSTLLVHQHHLLDVVVGLCLGNWPLHCCWRKGEPRA